MKLINGTTILIIAKYTDGAIFWGIGGVEKAIISSDRQRVLEADFKRK